ncbi:MAG: capsule assembly Wzi family protein [Phycisphaerales bacterium]
MRRTAIVSILSTVLTLPCFALVSTNVPLDHWSYAAVDKLADCGLIDSSMLTIRPLSRVEMARHVGQAMLALERLEDAPRILASIVDRLKDEYKNELVLIGLLDGAHGESSLKPLEDPYVRYLYADRAPDLENVRGDEYQRGSNYRAGFATRGTLWDTFAFYLHPEYADSSQMDGDVDLIEGYGKAMVGPFEVEAGKDSLWWGPARGGSILMSNNAEPFTLVKVSNPQPIQLPWIFRILGPVKGQWFFTQLEEDRGVPEARLSGVRLNIKPHPAVELGASRLVMFGGRGVPGVDLYDYAKMFLAMSNQEKDNQLAGLDASVLVPMDCLPLGDAIPWRSIKFYTDAAGEDEAGDLPSSWGALGGISFNDILKTGRTDLRIEYADNHVPGKPNVFYNHSLYTSGYTYEDRVIGHHMGTDSRDVFAQLSHYLTDSLVLDLIYNRQTHDLSTRTRPTIDVYECDLTILGLGDWRAVAGYRYEAQENTGMEDNHVLELQLIRRF